MRDRTYPTIIRTCKVAFRALGQSFDIVGAHHIPRTGGALLAVNHIGYADFVYGGLAAQPSGRLVRFMAKKEIFDHSVGGPVMRSMHHIAVDRSQGEGSLKVALDYLRAGEVVGIFPEATVSRAFVIKELKTGAARIAAEAGVPLIPVIVWGTHRIITKDHPRDFSRGKTIAITVGEPMYPTGVDPVGDTAELKKRMETLLDETIRRYPTDEQPPGSWWLPRAYGGSAPTLEEAKVRELKEKEDRLVRKAEKAARAAALEAGETGSRFAQWRQRRKAKRKARRTGA